MSENFIPLNQSTPTGGGRRFQGRNQNRNIHTRYHEQSNQNHQNSPWRNYNNQNRWGNNSQRNSSFGSDNNSSYGQEKSGIDAYLHPSMLQDPWAQLRTKMENSQVSAD